MKILLGFGLLLLPTTFLACSDGGASHCVPGNSVACSCTDGKMGSQTCNAGGTFEACRCTGSVTDMGTADLPPASGPRRLFVTGLKYKANALASVCQSVADGQGLGGTWKAWLSGVGLGPSGQVSALSRIQASGPWLLLNGEVAFRNRGKLATQPEVSINITENKVTVPLNEYVWTGTNLGGSTSDKNCQDWSQTSNGFEGTYGDPNSISSWTDRGTKTCDTALHVYCFED